MTENVANLRLPVPFFDLLMVLLVTCLVFVAPVRPDTQIEALDIAFARGKPVKAAPDTVLALVPKRAGSEWIFEIVGEGPVALETVVRRARVESRKIVLVVPPSTNVQDFVDIQTTLAAKNIPFALAIKTKESAP